MEREDWKLRRWEIGDEWMSGGMDGIKKKDEWTHSAIERKNKKSR